MTGGSVDTGHSRRGSYLRSTEASLRCIRQARVSAGHPARLRGLGARSIRQRPRNHDNIQRTKEGTLLGCSLQVCCCLFQSFNGLPNAAFIFMMADPGGEVTSRYAVTRSRPCYGYELVHACHPHMCHQQVFSAIRTH